MATGHAHRLDHEVLRAVVDAVVHAVLSDFREPLIARRRGDHGRARGLGQLHGGEAHATRARLDEHGLAGLQVAELEQAIVGRAELDRNRGGEVDVHRIGDRIGRARGHADQLCVGAVARGGGDLLAHGEAGDAFAHGLHRARRLVANDVGHRCEHATLAVEQVAALDADGADLDEQASGPDNGVGHVFIAKDFGTAGGVVNGCFHGGASWCGGYSTIAAGCRAGGEGGNVCGMARGRASAEARHRPLALVLA